MIRRLRQRAVERWDDLPLRTKGIAVIVIPLFPMLLLTLLFALAAFTTGRSNDWFAQMLDAKTSLRTAMELMTEAEAGVHDYLLTHDEASARRFTDAQAAFPPALQRLSSHAAAHRVEIAHVRSIETIAPLARLARALEYARSNPNGPPPLALTAEANVALKRARDEVVTMQTAADQTMQGRSQIVRVRLMQLSAVGVTFGLLSGVLAVAAFSSGVTRRIHRLRANAAHLSRGEPLVALPIARDELGELAIGMADAARLLAAARHELEQIAAAERQHAAEMAALNAELEAFSYSVSHDLRAPLRHVTGFAALLQKSAEERLTDTERRYADTIVSAAARMGRLIDDLLSFSRMGRAALQCQRVHLSDVIAEARREVSGAEGPPVAWTVHPLPDVHADPSLLRHAFVNLLSNAVKYSAGRDDASIEVGVHGVANGEAVVFVRDNGVGFDMQYAHKLFGVFQRLHSSDEFEGTGIGLANVRRIIHRHGGRVWAEGDVNRGATFFVALPTSPEAHS
jgi:signal transduction histidine kinase